MDLSNVKFIHSALKLFVQASNTEERQNILQKHPELLSDQADAWVESIITLLENRKESAKGLKYFSNLLKKHKKVFQAKQLANILREFQKGGKGSKSSNKI
jgi:hypothetical protein